MIERPHEIDAGAWNALLAQQTMPTPFMSFEYLAALNDSRSAEEGTGWAPRFVSVEQAGTLVAACPLYVKSHSYGEYVFDWAWSDAYRRHGLAYYPKLLVAVPFTPVPGSRLLARDADARAALAQGLVRLAHESQLSSLHVLFPDATDVDALRQAGCLVRDGVQFHWTQDALAPVADFDALLARLQREKRKKIQQERRRVVDAGVTFNVLEGVQIDHAAWDFFYSCYTLTYRAHHSKPYLTRDFFARMATAMPSHWVMFIASLGGERIAVSLIAVDRERRAAWGRYWGCTTHVPCLHFDACYYQPLAWCIAEGIERFEGGAQGEHKMARGLLPARTRSAHWLNDGRFANAVAEFLEREGAGVESYVSELEERSPFKPRA